MYLQTYPTQQEYVPTLWHHTASSGSLSQHLGHTASNGSLSPHRHYTTRICIHTCTTQQVEVAYPHTSTTYMHHLASVCIQPHTVTTQQPLHLPPTVPSRPLSVKDHIIMVRLLSEWYTIHLFIHTRSVSATTSLKYQLLPFHLATTCLGYYVFLPIRLILFFPRCDLKKKKFSKIICKILLYYVEKQLI